MTRALVAYSTNAGSTAAVAAAVAEELGVEGTPVDVCSVREVTDLAAYDAVIVGAPVIFGAWHGDAVQFVSRWQERLQRLPLAFFMMALHVTRTPATHIGPAAVYCDPGLATPPRRADRLSFTERHATPERYLRPVLEQAPLVAPASVAFLGGNMDYGALSPGKRLFARLVIRKPGDFRNWPAIRAWAANLRRSLLSRELAHLPGSAFDGQAARVQP